MTRFLVLLFLFFCKITFAQQFTKSPYSISGLGEEDYTGNATFSALGNTRAVYIDSTVLNIYNPSSYAFLSHGQPIFSTSAYIQNYQFIQNGSTAKNNALALSHMAFGFSFKNRLGFLFGFRPLSNTGYDVINTSVNALTNDTIKTQLYGSGNVTYAFAGLAIKILSFEKHKLSIGTNLGNVFGTNMNRQTVSIQNEWIGSIKQNSLKINGFNPEFGLNYQVLFSKSSNLSLSAIYKTKVTLSSESKTALISASDFKNENSFDTLDYKIFEGNLFNPSSYEIGFKYDFTKYFNRTSLRIPQFILLASYKNTRWSELNSSYLTTSLSDATHLNLGMQFAPHVDFYDRSKSISFFSRIRYRIGYEYALLPWSLNSKQLSTSIYSFGFGFPITSQRTLSSLNFAVNYGERKNGNSNDFIEKQLGYSLGITISPAFYDRWFKKNKID
jgi:hypothetical protein